MVNDGLMRDRLCNRMLPADGSPPVEWIVAEGLVPYPEAVAENGAAGGRDRRR